MKRMAAAGQAPKTSDVEVLETVKQSEHRFLATSEIAESVGVSTQAARKRLDRIQQRGDLDSRVAGNVRIWWVPSH